MDKKDTKIIKLKNDGKILRQIAKQVGISHVVVKKRLDRLTANETGSQAPPPGTGQLWDMDEYTKPRKSFSWLTTLQPLKIHFLPGSEQ